MRRAGLLVLLIPQLGVAQGDVVELPEECATGATTTLWRSSNRPLFPSHDGPEGGTTFEVRSKASGKPVASKLLEGNGRCLGWAPDARAYVVAGVHEAGPSLPIAELNLFGESGTMKGTSFDRAEYIAYAAVPSASRRFIAFVGSKRTGSVGLFALDTTTDRIRALGKAPAPPPRADDDGETRCKWGVDGQGSVIDVEPAVLGFDGDVLHATYGHDTTRARAKVRTTKTWDLAAP